MAPAENGLAKGAVKTEQSHADAAVRQLPAGTPAWQRAQDLKAYINSRPRK